MKGSREHSYFEDIEWSYNTKAENKKRKTVHKSANLSRALLVELDFTSETRGRNTVIVL